MLRKKIFKKNINIECANYIYRVISRYEDIRKLRHLKCIREKPYLLLSNVFERNIFCNEYRQLDAMFYIGLKNLKLSNRLDLILTEKQRLAYRFGKFIKCRLSLKEYNKKHLIKNIFIFFIRFAKSIVDILFLTIILFLFSLKRKFNRSDNFQKFQELYTITYSRKISKETNLITYFYPDFEERRSKKVFITDYDGYRFFFTGIIEAGKNKNILSILDIIKLKDVINSLIDLVNIYFFEVINCSIFKYGSFFSIFESLQNINRRYFSLLIYHASTRLIKFKNQLNIYAWGEGLPCDKAFIIAINNFIKENKLCLVKLYTYIATPISKNYYPHYMPSIFDINCGIWSQNMLVYDLDSFIEIKELINKKGMNINLEIIRKGMYRLNNVEVNRNEIKIERFLTFFTHGSIHELFLMLVSFYLDIYRNMKYQDNLNLVYFRLHPLLDKEVLNSQIKKLQRIFKFKFPEYICIPIKEEDMQISLFKTNYAFFGESTYINYAIKNDIKVIYTKTSFLFNSPINSHLAGAINIKDNF